MSEEKKIIVIGSGLVSQLVVDLLSREKGYKVTLATRNLVTGTKVMGDNPNVVLEKLDAEHDPVKMRELIGKHDLAISVLPAALHPLVATACIECKTNYLSSSYVSPQMQSFHEDAVKNNLTFLNECGLDPGIDHMSAMKEIIDAKKDGWNITGFYSYCGGLVSPECLEDNPFGYKFSWSPKGVLLAALNPARYLKDGKIVEIEGGHAYDIENTETFPPDSFRGYFLQGIPNRDSTTYASLYGIEDTAKTMLRGTFRFSSFPNIMRGLVALGLCKHDKVEDVLGGKNAEDVTNRQFLGALVCGDMNKKKEEIEEEIRKKVNKQDERYILYALRWLDFLSEKKLAPKPTVMDCTVALMQEKMMLREEDRDLVLMRHEFVMEKDGKMKRRFARMVRRGDEEYSAMGFTVGAPLVCAAKAILEGKIKSTGILRPITPEIYEPVLAELESMGIKFFVEDVEE